MFATIKQIFNPKNKDLQKRILFTFACLIIFKIGTAIVVPGIDQAALGTKSLGFLELINVMGGGALERFSIFALGVMPYITAQIIIQLLEMDIVPYLADLSKQGGTGRTKLNQITRVAGIALAFVQGYIYSFTYVSGGTVIDYMEYSLILTAGTSLLLWIGDQMTTKGVGNGMSILIMAGILSNLPNMFATAWESLIGAGTTSGIILFIIYVIVYLIIVFGIVYFQLAERRIPIQYANKSTSAVGSQNYLPFKLNSAGVIPVILKDSERNACIDSIFSKVPGIMPSSRSASVSAGLSYIVSPAVLEMAGFRAEGISSVLAFYCHSAAPYVEASE